MDFSDWMDEEKSTFIKVVRSFGKDFSMISRCMRTRSNEQCRVFFSKGELLPLKMLIMGVGGKVVAGVMMMILAWWIVVQLFAMIIHFGSVR